MLTLHLRDIRTRSASMLVEDRLIVLKSSATTGVIGAYEMCVRTMARHPIARIAGGQLLVDDAAAALRRRSGLEADVDVRWWSSPSVAPDAIACALTSAVDLVDDRRAGRLAGRLGERVVGVDRATEVKQAENDEDDDRQHDRELDQCLAARGATSASAVASRVSWPDRDRCAEQPPGGLTSPPAIDW